MSTVRAAGRGTFIVFVAGAIVGGAATSLLMFASREIVRCHTGDFAALPPANTSASIATDYTWVRHARRCDIGAYSVVTPLRDDEQAIVVRERRNTSRAVVAADRKAIGLFDPDGKRGLRGLVVLSADDTETIFNVGGSSKQLLVKGQAIDVFDLKENRILLSVDMTEADGIGVTYSAHDLAQDAWVETFVGRDGNPYLRTTEIRGHLVKTELQQEGRWLPRRIER